jgi:FdhE protein
MNRSKWDRRIQRADELASEYPFAAEVLRFYKGIATFQKELYAYAAAARGKSAQRKITGLFEESLDLTLLLPKFQEFLARVDPFSPAPVAHSAAHLRSQPTAQNRDFLSNYWRTATNAEAIEGQADALLAWTFLQPYAELLAEGSDHKPGNDAGTCPFCGAKPLVGVLRPEGDGAKRFLICSLCATEWPFRRILCPGCGEEAVNKLAVYTADDFTHVRVEGCDTCQHYIKTVDLTKNGRAVPIVDELATIPLNLWAQEHGYVKLRTNLLGI